MPSWSDSLLVKPLPYARQRRSLWLRRALIFATVVVLVDAVVGQSGLAQSFRARHEYEQALRELNALRAENAALTERARQLNQDWTAIESLAREELGYLRRGEIVFVVKPAALPAPDAHAGIDASAEPAARPETTEPIAR
jgi:cell division protein FtsB